LGRPGWAGRRRPAVAPQYPPAAAADRARQAVTVLHLAGPSFGRGQDPAALQAAVWGDLMQLTDAGAPAPDLLVVTGDLTASGSPRECDQALAFLTGLRSLLSLEAHRVAVVPGGQDVSLAACRAYFATCEADEMRPRAPYWPKWRHYHRLFHELYQGLDAVFDSDQPWTLFPVPELHTVVAGLNSSMAYSHRAEDRYGLLGREQATWFAQVLRAYEDEGWLRVGALRHPVADARPPAGTGPATGAAATLGAGLGPGPLRDADVLSRLTAPRLHLLLHGPAGHREAADAPTDGTLPAASGAYELPVFGAAGPGRHQLLSVTPDGVTRWVPDGPGGEPRRFAAPWRAAHRAFAPADGPAAGPGADEPPGPNGPHARASDTLPGGVRTDGSRTDGVRADGVRTDGVRTGGARADHSRPHAAPDAPPGPVPRDPAPAPDPVSDPPDPPGPSDASETRAVDSPLDALLARVAEVCRTRHEGTQLRRVPGSPPQLLVTWPEPEFVVRQQRVAVCVGTPTAEDVDRFVDHVHASDPEPDAELVHDGPPPARELRDRARRRGVRVRSFTEFQGLLDLRGYVAAQSERLRADRSYAPDLYLPHRFREAERPGGERPGGSDGDEDREGLVEEVLRLLDADHGRFLLLLGDFGHGKTYALHELARRIPEELPRLTPLLIELGGLDKAHTLDGLVAAHLASHGVDTIDLRAFRYMLRQGRIVLVFDGFDELVNQVSYDRAADHLQVLLDAAVDNAKIVVSSRTQHFRSQAQVLTALGERVGLLPQRRVLALRAFTPRQIRAYLVNRYGDERAADRRMRLLQGIPDLLALCANPRLLSFVADLDHDRLRAVAGAGRALSPAGLYQEVFASWLEFEVRRGHGRPGAVPGLAVGQLWEAVTALALRLWDTGRNALRVDELTDVTEVLTGLAETRLSVPMAAHAVGSGSLLVRTDEGLFQFIHGSVVEWLIAREAAARLARGDLGLLGRRPLTQLAVEFLCDLADRRVLLAWVDRVLAGHHARADGHAPDGQATDATDGTGGATGNVTDGGAAARAGGDSAPHRVGEGSEIARANALKVLGRLRVPAHTDLRGALLAGEDLSHRDLSGVDLTGADLTDARLTGAGLAGAVLRGARLAGARLDDADLSATDLRGADLRRARLVRTDLRGARVAGSHWHRAALIGARADEAVLSAPELRLAAVAPGLPVEPGLRPPTVGVPYGFHARTSRLPDPVAYSPDGELLVVGSDGGGVLVCDAATGTALRTLQGHVGRVYAVQFRGRVLATGGSDGAVLLWDPVSGRCRHRLEIHPDGVWPVTLDEEGRLLATGDAEGTVTLWDAAFGTEVHLLPGHTAPVFIAEFGPDGRTLVTADAAGDVRLWDTRSGRLLGALEGHSGAVFRARFSPDGTLLATSDAGGEGRGGAVRLWSTADWSLKHTLTGHTGRVYVLDFHPGGRLLVSGDTDGRVLLWDPAAGTPAWRATGCTGAVYQAVFSPDGTVLAAGDSDGRVRVWGVPAPGPAPAPAPAGGGDPGAPPASPAPPGTPAPPAPALVPLRRQPPEHLGSVWACRFRPRPGPGDGPAPPAQADGGALMVTVGNDGVVRLVDPATGQGRRILRGHGRRIGSLSFSADGSLLAAGGNDGVVRVWDPATGRRLRELTGHSDRLVSAVFGPRGSLLGTASNDGDVYLWDAATGEYQREIDAETEHVWAEAFSADGELLATANDDDTVRLWYRATGAHRTTLAKHRGRVRSIAFAADGRRLATGCDDSYVRLWDVADGRLAAQLDGHTDRVYAVVYGTDGESDGGGRAGRPWLASASWDGQAIVWDGDRPVRRLTGHSGRLWAAAAHPTRPLLATGGDDRTVRLWNPLDGTEAAVLTGHLGRVLALAFSPDGSLLASGGEGGVVGLWRVSGDGACEQRATLIGTPGGWAALSPSGGYKYGDDVAGEFWHVVGMCRFEPGELDGHLPGVGRLPLDERLT
ncbi:pentapeptide repeat-containing protein, partial [Streptomyces sp. B1866]|uniref:WD40 domain-containing protein n=1 Tax=Streptomyces sp. B1866 TaxID=3075431 RepID=UPI00288CDE33